MATRELPPTMRHAIELMPAIRQLTQEQNWNARDIDHVYLSLGPGSFTGLRIAVAITRALHQAVSCRIVGVPSLDVIAQNAPTSAAVVLPVLDAKRNQIFAARYERLAPSSPLIETAAPALVDPAAFVRAALGRAVSLSQGAPVHVAILGEGIDYHRPALFTHELPADVQLIEVSRDRWHGRAAAVHDLGHARAMQDHFSDPHTLIPLYIRLPEAEEVYRKKHNLPLS